MELQWIHDKTCHILSSQLFTLCQNEIDMNTLNITNQKPFVIDWQIVITDQFKMEKDANVYAMGSISKLSGKYNKKNVSFQYANSFNIGIQFAHKLIDNILTDNNNNQFEMNMEKPTCIVTQSFEGCSYFYAYNP